MEDPNTNIKVEGADMEANDTKITELGICINDCIATQPKMKTKKCNVRLKIYREFTLATLSTLAEIKARHLRTKFESHQIPTQVFALDALSCTGIAGIQWKKHLSKDVHVTLADHDDIIHLKNNVEANSLSSSELKLNPLRESGKPLTPQKENEVHVCQADARIVMTMEAFNFIYLNHHKGTSSYFEPAVQSLLCGGLFCLVFPDVSMFARSPHVVRRYFDADVVKTEYLKEMSARIILANVARAAARHNKGISSQYVLCHEDNLLICVKVTQGHAAADASVVEVERLLHCRICEERVFIPNQLAPQEDPYSLLHCSCKHNNPGKTAVILGPMWKGCLNDPEFLKSMHAHGKQLKLSLRFFELVKLLIVEGYCAMSAGLTVAGIRSELTLFTTPHEKSQPFLQGGTSTCEDTLVNDTREMKDNTKSNCIDQDMAPESSTENMLLGSFMESRILESNSKTGNCSLKEKDLRDAEKRKHDNSPDEHLTAAKLLKKETNGGGASGLVCVPFYYRVSKFKRTNIPKLDKLVTILHSFGHRASRTHFDSSAVRTSATAKEFLHVFE